MQPTTRFHHGITNAILQEADFVFHNPVAFHPANGVFDADSDRRNPTIDGFLRRGEFPATRLLFRLDKRDVGQDESLEPHILIEITSGGQAIALQLSQDFIVGLPFIGGTQEANLTGFIEHKEVFDRMAFLFAAVVFLLVFWIGWAVDRSLSTIVPKRGDGGPSLLGLRVRSVANSAAVRAGSSSCCPKAWFSTVWRR
jgi:hypothetical protein